MVRGLLLVVIILMVIILMGCFSFLPASQWWFIKNIISNFDFVKALLSILILLLITIFLFFGVMEKKYSLKLEKLNFGGLNILFDSSGLLYERSVRNFLDTKRSVFKIDPHSDSFEEVFNSLYDIYNFIRVEIRVLDLKRKRDMELYRISNKMLKKLNQLLTKHQNNYRRWHKYISANNTVLTEKKDSNGENVSLIYHLTPIGTIQTHYYHFSQLMADFEDVNNFFCSEVSVNFNIDIAKWEW
ncbi:hypothetical protein [Pectobacterium parmentieri]|uniref:hypothetical protein n=1 Tax=Pectobacterium parmentieri TaxID=1905730 RepID=UPI0020312D9B|nr:hypothetical protein [Pectobacterium parmentieri]MCL6381567.1 hypothetical protein [Pectobacterium parmentieri]